MENVVLHMMVAQQTSESEFGYVCFMQQSCPTNSQLILYATTELHFSHPMLALTLGRPRARVCVQGYTPLRVGK